MAPTSLFFILLDLLVRFRDWSPLDDNGRGKEDSTDGTATAGTRGQLGFGHPLDHFKTRSAVFTTFLGVTGNVDVNGHRNTPQNIDNGFQSIVKGKTLVL